MKKLGFCRLCNSFSELESGHVWSKFIYKQYVGDQDDNGRFIDLKKGIETTSHYKLYMFCGACEDLICEFENKSAPFIKQIYEQNQSSYDEWFRKFLVSISYRFLLYRENNTPRHLLKYTKRAKRVFKEYLLNKRPELHQHTQLAYALDNSTSFSRILGGDIYETNEACYIYCQCGPIILFSFLNRIPKNEEYRLWDNYEVKYNGILKSISNWTIGGNITQGMYEVLLKTQNHLSACTKYYDIKKKIKWAKKKYKRN